MMEKGLLNKVLSKIPYGLVVIGSTSGDGFAAMVATWVTQVSFKPPLVAAAIESGSAMRGSIEKSALFSLNLLPAGGKDLAKDFLKSHPSVGSAINGHDFRKGKHGSPFLVEATASAECRVIDRFATGDHVLFVGEVVDAVVKKEGDVLTLKETGWKYQK
jgi:flavin reductase (DIM6/NTAB) family NADH-FMN oxidoreductase RutF